jgi:histone deacetylase-like protein
VHFAGYDAAMGDPMGHNKVTPNGYKLMLKELLSLAEGRVVLALEGGYKLGALADSFAACVGVRHLGIGILLTAVRVLPALYSWSSPFMLYFVTVGAAR